MTIFTTPMQTTTDTVYLGQSYIGTSSSDDTSPADVSFDSVDMLPYLPSEESLGVVTPSIHSHPSSSSSSFGAMKARRINPDVGGNDHLHSSNCLSPPPPPPPRRHLMPTSLSSQVVVPGQGQQQHQHHHLSSPLPFFPHLTDDETRSMSSIPSFKLQPKRTNNGDVSNMPPFLR